MVKVMMKIVMVVAVLALPLLLNAATTTTTTAMNKFPATTVTNICRDIQSCPLPKGPAGPQGPKGDVGPMGPAGPSSDRVYFKSYDKPGDCGDVTRLTAGSSGYTSWTTKSLCIISESDVKNDIYQCDGIDILIGDRTYFTGTDGVKVRCWDNRALFLNNASEIFWYGHINQDDGSVSLQSNDMGKLQNWNTKSECMVQHVMACIKMD